MKYASIKRHQRVWPIRVQCRVLGLSVSGFHQHGLGAGAWLSEDT